MKMFILISALTLTLMFVSTVAVTALRASNSDITIDFQYGNLYGYTATPDYTVRVFSETLQTKDSKLSDESIRVGFLKKQIDLVPPNITIHHPVNSTTYTSSSMDLNWTADKDVYWCSYSLDDAANITSICNGWQYQEPANSTECSGGWSSACASAYDSDWGTYALANSDESATVFFNYTKPVGASIASQWNVKDNGGRVNLSFSASCWSMQPLQIRALSYNIVLSQRTDWDCYNGTAWHTLRTDSGTALVYEEAMWWYFPQNTTLTGLAEGLHNITVFANGSRNSVGRSNYTFFTIDTLPPGFSSNTNNNSAPKRYEAVEFSVTVTDATSSISGYVFSFDNGSGVLVNDSFTAFTVNPETVSVAKTIPSARNSTVRWQWHVNDSLNHWNSSGIEQLTVANSPTSISSILTPTITPTAYSVTPALLGFNATDNDGLSDLNAATAQCKITKTGATTRSNSSCSATEVGTVNVFNCTVHNQFYDPAGAWSINCSVEDSGSVLYQNVSETLTVNVLDRVDQDSMSVTFGSIAPKSNDNEATAGTTFINGGNQDYATVQVTAHNLTDGSDIIDATQFTMDLDTGQTTGQTYLIQGIAQTLTGFTLSKCTSPCSTNSTEVVYWYVDVPAVLPSGSYTNAANWAADIST